MAIKRVLGIDVASGRWADIGSAVIDFDCVEKAFTSVIPGVIEWPAATLTASALAKTIDAFAREYAVCAVALDGPQGWRDPDTHMGLPGVGRRCEYRCRTQGKTGSYPVTYPANQRAWIEFSIDLFGRLLEQPGVVLANGPNPGAAEPYLVLECFPTSAWRSSGLTPLPAKGKNPDLAPFVNALMNAYSLPGFDVDSHDDLQAVVAALCAAAAAEGPCVALPEGIAAKDVGGRRVEGLIWNVAPGGVSQRERVAASESRPIEAPRTQARHEGRASVYVTQKVLDQVNRSGASQMQIALKNLPGGSSRNRIRIGLRIGDRDYEVILGDSHAAWFTHQDSRTKESFEELFALAADSPGIHIPVSRREMSGRRRRCDSSRTRVAPVLNWLYCRDTSGRTWLPQLLALVGAQCPGALDKPLVEARWWPNEIALSSPLALLTWLVHNCEMPDDPAALGTGETKDRRLALIRRDEATRQLALTGLSQPGRARAWYALEGPSQPDAYLATEEVMIVIEGKRTESQPTTKTEWMTVRHQMLRHLDAAWEFRKGRTMIGLMIVEGADGNTEVLEPWRDYRRELSDPTVLARSMPHRSERERVEIFKSFAGVTTWQAVTEAVGVPAEVLIPELAEGGS